MKQKKGLATLSPERRREIARMGGNSSPMKFVKGSDRAREIGKLGGRPKAKQ